MLIQHDETHDLCPECASEGYNVTKYSVSGYYTAEDFSENLGCICDSEEEYIVCENCGHEEEGYSFDCTLTYECPECTTRYKAWDDAVCCCNATGHTGSYGTRNVNEPADECKCALIELDYEERLGTHVKVSELHDEHKSDIWFCLLCHSYTYRYNIGSHDCSVVRRSWYRNHPNLDQSLVRSLDGYYQGFKEIEDKSVVYRQGDSDSLTCYDCNSSYGCPTHGTPSSIK